MITPEAGPATTDVPPHSRAQRDWLGASLAVLLALLPLSFSIEPGIKALPAALLFVAAIVRLARAPVRDSYRRALPVIGPALALVLMDVLNVLAHRQGWRPLDHTAHVLLYLVIAAAFARPLRMALVWAGFSLTAAGLGLVCVVQHYGLGIARAHGLNGGDSAAIECATLLLGLALLAWVQLLRTTPGQWRWWLHGAGLVLGMYGALLTQSRGPLLAFVPALVLVLAVDARRTGRGRRMLLLGLAVCLGGALAMATLHGALLGRFTTIQQEVAGFDQGDPDGSVGERLEMWRTATRAFAAHPLAGVGIDGYARYTQREIAAGRSDRSIARYNQPHNEYLRALATGGLPQWLALLAMFGLPLRYFGRRLRDADEVIASLACGALAIIVLYLFCALGESVFYRVMSQSFFFFVVLGFALRVAYLERLRAAGHAPAATT